MIQHCVECGYQERGSWDACPECGWVSYWKRESESDREHVVEVRLSDPTDAQVTAWNQAVARLAETYGVLSVELRTREID